MSWTAPANGGSAITSYTVTPFIGTTAQTPTTVTGTPPATSTTVTGLTNGTAYTFTVTATNAIGTGPASTPSNPVTPSSTSCSACTIWAASATPTTADEGDPSSVELGVKFTSDLNGVIKGIRFYKSAANTGTHIGNLWTASGTKLASATFTGETASGWQQVNFATPVPVTAGTVYVASYFAPAGHYAGDGGYFAASGVDNAPLHALKDGVSGGNGVYVYGSASGFPNLTFNSENYWVDAVFSTGPATVPTAPTNVTATAANASAQVTWTAPSDGGSPLTSYTVTPFIGTTAQTPTTVTGSPPATTTTVTGLTNGTAYTFTVTATNAVGTGPASAPSSAVTPTAPTAPGAPTAVNALAGAGSAQVSWTAPSNGGSAITSYTVTPFIGTTAQTPTTVTGSPPATSTTVTGLTNGTAYTFTVTATNAIGTGPASAASNAVTPTGPTAPAAPTAVTATAGNASAQVSWTAPANGGSAITSYTVTPFIGTTAQTPTTVTGTPPATTTTVSGLTNGTAYTFTVTATNAIGTGPASAASNSVTPTAPTAPAAPTGVTATAGNASALVSWTAPSNGGSAITSYTVTPFIGTTAQTPTTVTGTPPATTTTVSGLTNGTAYTFTVTATNAIGTGPASAPSSAVTPTASVCSACTIWAASATPTTPSAADTGAVTLGVKFKADVSGKITGIRFYKGTGNTGTHVGNLWSASGTQLASATFTNETASGWQQVNFTTPVSITAGTVYVASYFAPVGHYAADGGYFATAGVDNVPLHALQDGVSGGDGVYAYGSAAAFPNNTFLSANYWVDVVFSSGPAAAPAAPTGVTATAGAGSAQVSWTAPGDGGSPLTSYTVTPFIGANAQTPTTVTGTPPATSTTVTGLTNGTAYTFTVTATNAIGTGPASAASNSITPTAPTAPAAPTGVTATAGNASAQGELDRARERRQRDHQVHGHAVHRDDRADTDHRDRHPTRNYDDGERIDQRHRLHLHRHRHQRDRHRTRLRPVERRHPDRADRARRTGHRGRDGGQRVGAGELDRAVRRWQRDHQVHGHAVHRDDRADTDHGDRHPAGDQHHGDRADQRHRLHLHGDRDQRDRHRARLRRLELGHPLVHHLRRVHDLGVVGHADDSERLGYRSRHARSEVQGGREREDHRDPLLQGDGQHGYARREPVVGDRDEAGHRDVHQRDRLRLAAGQLHDAGVDHRRHRLRRLLLRTGRPLRRRRRLLRHLGGRQRAAARTAGRCQRQVTASTHTAAPQPSRTTPSFRPTTGSTSCSPPREWGWTRASEPSGSGRGT